MISSKYFDINEIQKINVDPSYLFLFHFNICSPKKNFDELEYLFKTTISGFQPATLLKYELLNWYFSRFLTTSAEQLLCRTPLNGLFCKFMSYLLLYFQNLGVVFSRNTFHQLLHNLEAVQCSPIIEEMYRKSLMQKSYFNKIAQKLYLNNSCIAVLHFRFAPDLKNTFFVEHLQQPSFCYYQKSQFIILYFFFTFWLFL